MTLNDLLGNATFRGNKTFLAKTLKINRGTLIKYLMDEEGKHHLIITNFDEGFESMYELFINKTNGMEKEIKK